MDLLMRFCVRTRTYQEVYLIKKAQENDGETKQLPL